MNKDQIDNGRLGKLLASSMLARGLIMALSAFAVSAVTAAHAGTLPTGGNVATGSASIVTGANSVIVTQTSGRAVINWTSFSVGQNNTITFNQPNATSATLNRVTGSTTSVIAGDIVSNGAVYLINPNGIAITPTGTVETAGGFIASTLNLADADFMGGRTNFAGNGASAKVSNAGTIVAGQGAYVALLGGSVANSGSITVPLGKVGLGSGEQIALDLNGDGFMQVALPTNALTGASPLIDNSGTITVTGGLAQLSAATVKAAVRNVINMSGTINADSATGSAGHIQLLGGEGGTVTAGGTLSARATGPTGDGGLVETSGATVNFTGLTVNTSSVGGKTGTWLVDPTDLTVDAAAAATISSNLATTNVTLQTNASGASGQGIQSAGAGDIAITSAISWSSANTLGLSAWNAIAISAAISAPSGGLTLSAGNSGLANAGAITDTAALSVGLFSLTGGSWSQLGANLPAFSATDFGFAPSTATFLRATGGSGTTAAPYLIADVYGLQGVGSLTLLNSNFALANAIDASGTAQWNAGLGFMPIGSDGVNVIGQNAWTSGFTGTFDGRGFAISGLALNRPLVAYAGTFAYVGGSIMNLTIENAQFSAGTSILGLLAGYGNFATIANVHTSGTVTGVGGAGGLIGGGEAVTVSDSSSSATVRASYGYDGSTVGGLAGGLSSSTVTRSYATGTVTGTSAGGLVGEASGATQINQSYATGAVSGTTLAGGLVGTLDSGSSVLQSYATGSVTGTVVGSGFERLGGLVGWSISAQVNQAYATGSVTGSATPLGGIDAGGLIGAAQSTTVTQAYATGAINSGTNGFENASGGPIGNLYSSTVTNSYWDSYSTGHSVGVGLTDFSTFSASSVTSDPAQSSAVNYAYSSSAYSAFTSADWAFFDGRTRPFGAWELPTAVNGVVTIVNSHQLQLISSALGQNYVLGNNIDLSETGAVTAGTPSSYAGMWSSAGFVPIGFSYNASANNFLGTPFTGNFDGQGYSISNLFINLPGSYNVGLFSGLGGSANVNSVILNSVRVTGGSFTGGLVGDIPDPMGVSVTNSVVSGNVSGISTGLADGTGGLIGAVYGPNVTVTADRTSGTVNGAQDVGGLVGFAWNASISKSASSANVNGSMFSEGGLVGSEFWGNINQSFATGSVTGNGNVGGLVGTLGFNGKSASISNSYAAGEVVLSSPNEFSIYTGLGVG